MIDRPIRIAITGAAGNIAYQFMFMLFERAFKGVRIDLRLLDLPNHIERMKGMKMELEDCAIEYLNDVIVTSEAADAFEGVDWIIALGAYPRLQGMERSDLLEKNAEIFKALGQSIDQYASKNVQVVVIGNPCNTNAMIASNAAPSIPKRAFTAMTLLDQNRAIQSLSDHLGCCVSDIDNLIIWGNHSATLVPSVEHASCRGERIVLDSLWYESWVTWVQNRGASVIAQRGASSAASASYAICDHIRHLRMHDSKVFSLSVCSNGEYGSVAGTWVSMPHQMCAGERKLLNDWSVSDAMGQRLQISFEELASEKKLCEELSLL